MNIGEQSEPNVEDWWQEAITNLLSEIYFQEGLYH